MPPNLNEEGAERSFYAFLLFFSVPGMVSIGGTLRTFINKTCSLWVMSGKKASIQELISTAAEIRKSIVRMIGRAKASHIGGALSAADILAALYFRVLSIDPKNPKGEERDIFILSKGHCCSALYAALGERGFFPKEDLGNFCRDGSTMWGHVSRDCVPGAEATTGSLGHGLSIGLGMALAAKLKGMKKKVVVMLSDGECDEGAVWEAALCASQFRLDNLIAIVDYNKIQSLGSVEEVMNLDPLADKWASFGWSVQEIDGHDMENIVEAMEGLPFKKGAPSVVIAHTIKGRGISFMENKLEWHYKSPTPEQVESAILEIDAGKPSSGRAAQ